MSVPIITAPAEWGAQFHGLGLTCDIATAARLLGIGRTTAFRLLGQGRFPVEVLGFGRVRRVRTADLLAYLRVGLADSGAQPPGDPTPPDLAGGPHAA